jgi:hypothetical protein
MLNESTTPHIPAHLAVHKCCKTVSPYEPILIGVKIVIHYTFFRHETAILDV